MGPLAYRVRAVLRHRWWGAVGLAALVALAVVVPLTTAAAARRTDSSLPRLRDELRPSHGNVQFEEDGPPADAADRLAALPGVEAVGEGISILARPRGSELGLFESFGQGAADGSGLQITFDRPRLDAGRMPRRADEVLLARRVARSEGLGVGDTIELETFSADGLWAALEGQDFAYDGPVLELRVVGVGRSPEELTLGGDEAVAPAFTLAPAFFDRWEDDLGWFDGVFVFRLEDGLAGVPDFERSLREAFAGHDDVAVYTNEQHRQVDQAVDAQTTGLALMAVVSALAAVVAIGQAVARFARSSSQEDRALAAIGAGPRLRSACRVAAVAVPVGVGVGVAAGSAVIASRWFPTGAAGRLEPSPGVSADLVVLLPGTLLVFLLAIAAAASTTRPLGRSRPGGGAAVHVPAELPVPVVAGLRAAMEAGRGSTPTRSAVLAAVAGVAGVAAATVFGASLVRLIDTPSRYGWNWDLDVGLGDLLTDEEAIEASASVAGDDRIDAAMLVRLDNVVLDEREEFSYAVRPIVGEQLFTVVEGRAPETRGEIALGGTSLEAMDVSIGDTVQGQGADGGSVPLRVVGQVVLPVVENTDPARGVSMTADTFEQLASPGSGFPELYIRAVDGADLDRLAADLGDVGVVARDTPPPAIVNLRGVERVPFAIAAFLGILAAAASTHAVVTALNRRRRELAVLRTLGFVRHQLATTIVTHALLFGVVGLVLGLPLGLGVGRQAWRAVAGGLGFATDTLVPGRGALIVPGVIALFLLVAALPARAAARTPAATVLRSE